MQDAVTPYMTLEETTAPAAAPANTRRLYFDSASNCLRAIDSASAIQDVGSDIFGFGLITAPLSIDTDWTAVNCGEGVVTDQSANVLHMQHTGQGGDKIRGYVRPLVGKTTCAFYSFMNTGDLAYQQVGMFAYDESSTKVKSFLINGNNYVVATSWAAPSTWSGESSLQNISYGRQMPMVWMQYEEDVSNRMVRMSPNGVFWITILTESKSTHLSATHIGWGIYTPGTRITQASLVHWKEG
jgi:hypothetical protein